MKPYIVGWFYNDNGRICPFECALGSWAEFRVVMGEAVLTAWIDGSLV